MLSKSSSDKPSRDGFCFLISSILTPFSRAISSRFSPSNTIISSTDIITELSLSSVEEGSLKSSESKFNLFSNGISIISLLSVSCDGIFP